MACLEKMIECQTKPRPQEKYSGKQRKEWKELWEIYETCTVFEQTERPNIEDIVERLHLRKSPSHAERRSGESSERDVHLKVSQALFFEKCSEIAANQIQAGLVLDQTEINQLNSYITSGNATNSCKFLCLQIAESILRANVSSTISWKDVAEISESVILTLPDDVNDIRQVSLTYDVMEAYTILRNANLLSSDYTFTEELPYAFGVFSKEGKAKLSEKIKELRKNSGETFVALYTCEPYTLLLGFILGSLFILDTHAVPEDCGGMETGMVNIFHGPPEEASTSACLWLWKRLESAGVQNGPQSLSVMKADIGKSR